MSQSPSHHPPSPELGPGDFAAIALAWLVPGVGHMLIGQRARGMIFAATIHGLFFLGLFIGGIHAISPADQPIWSVTQFLSGWPMLLAHTILSHATAATDYSPKIQDIGSVYCGIAGMLNLLVVFDVLLRISGGKPRHDAPTGAGERGGGRS